MFEAAGHARRPHATRCASTRPTRPTRSTPASSSSTTATTRSFERLLAELGVATQPSDDELRRQRRRAATSSTAAPRRTACSRTARTSSRRGSTAWSPTSRASTARRRALLDDARTTARRSATGCTSAGYSPRVHRAADRPPGVRRLVGRPAADVDASRPASSSSSSTTTACSACATARSWRTVGGGSQRYVEALARRSRDRLRLRTPVRAIERHDDRVERHAARRRARALRRGRARHPLRPGARAARRRDAAEHEILGAIPYQANEAVLHTDRGMLPRRRRAWASWNYHLLDEPTGRTTVTYHMNRLQSLRRRPRVLRHAQPHRRDRPGAA